MAEALALLRAKREAEQLARAETVAPEGWTRGREWQGDRGVGSTGPVPDGVTLAEEEMLQRAGFDPDEWSIIPPINHREWDANLGNGEVRKFHYNRFNVVRKVTAGHSADELLKVINRRRPHKPGTVDGAAPVFNLAIADLQLFKLENSISGEDQAERFFRAVDQAVAEYKLLRKARGYDHVHIAFLGDCVEGFVSQGGANAWRTTAGMMEQFRVFRRLVLYTIDAFRTIASKITVTSVPGNHGDVNRQVNTTFDDNYDVEALVAVQDMMDLNPEAYGHVETFLPKYDTMEVTLQVGDTIITHIHGHQMRPNKEWDWWKGQAFDPNNPPSQSTILLHGHGHHFHSESKGGKLHIMAPAFELNSQWWINKTGERGDPALMTFETQGGKAHRFAFHRG